MLLMSLPPRRLKQFMFVCGCRPVYIAPRGAAVSGADSGQHVMRMLSCTTITCRRTAGSGWWKPQSWLIVASACLATWLRNEGFQDQASNFVDQDVNGRVLLAAAAFSRLAPSNKAAIGLDWKWG